MGPEELKAEYWKITAAATNAIRAWDHQQTDPDGDWGDFIVAMEQLRKSVFGDGKHG